MCGRACRRIAVLTLALPVLLAAAAEAGLDEWTTRGPFDGSVPVLVIDPQTPTTLYAGSTGGGVYRSTDGGATWSAVNRGLPGTSDGIVVRSLAIDPETPTTLYAGIRGGAFKSTDAGEHWSAIDHAPLAIDPETPTSLYAPASAGSGLMRSRDGGATWSAVNDGLVGSGGGLPGVAAVAIDPETPATLYAGTVLSGIFRSTDGGDHWSAASDGLPVDMFGFVTSVSALAIDPQVPATVYAGTVDGLFKSTDAGGHWSALADPAGALGVFSLAIDPETPTTIYAGTGEYFETRFGGVIRSLDGGASWSTVQFSDPVRALVVDPRTPATVYGGTDGGGVIKSIDGGDRWDAVNHGISTTRVFSLAVDLRTPARVYAGTDAEGAFRSPDGGGSWSAVNDGLDFVVATVRALAIDPQTPTALYAGTELFLGGGVFRSVDAGASWRRLDGLPTFSNVLALAIDPRTPTTLYAGGTLFSPDDVADHGVFKSTDGGDSWSAADAGLLPAGEIFIEVAALAIDPRTPTTLYAGSDLGIAKSTDGGGSWSGAGAGLPDPGAVEALAIDPRTPTTLYAGTRDHGVYRSTDGGASWSAVNGGLPVPRVQALAIDPQDPAHVYAGTAGGGVLASADGGDSWRPLDDGLTHLDVLALAIDPATSTTLYAGTRGGGVFELRRVGGREVLPLHRGRFRVEVEWRDFRGAEGRGRVAVVPDETSQGAALRSRDSAVARFFSPDNWELLVKVLDGRALNGRFWVYLAAATDVELTTTVTDTSCGHVQTYRNPPGRAAPAVTDTAAFRGCAAPAPPSCAPGPTTFCLGDGGRFRVETAWRDFTGGSGSGRGVSLPRAGLAQSRDSGLFYFFSPDNWELLVKVLDGCGINDHYWVFAAATTDVEYRLRVTDTQSGDIKEYTNPLGNAAAAVTDTGAFARCP